jgi:ABC-2 type transport system ATP-binding protein
VTCPQPRQALAALKGYAGISDAQLFGDRLHLVLDPNHPGREHLVHDLEALGIAVSDSRTILPSLEDVFISRLSS